MPKASHGRSPDSFTKSGILVFSDLTLLAVLVYLDADFYDLRGQWHLEAGFNPVPGESRCFRQP